MAKHWLEDKVIELINKAGGPLHARNTRNSGSQDKDNDILVTAGPYTIQMECKYRQGTGNHIIDEDDMEHAYGQARVASIFNDTRLGALVIDNDRQDPTVTMKLEDFIELMSELLYFEYV